MNESVICSAGCGLPSTLNCTVPQAAGPCATASGGPPTLARNVSWIPSPGGGGQEAADPIVDSWRLSTSAASRQTTARPVIVTGAGGRVTCGPRLATSVIVTTRAADDIRSGARQGTAVALAA
jgi:hypothetical protein